jgi:hypothetical protein
MFEGHPLFSMENVYRAYRRCRRHKRGTVNAGTGSAYWDRIIEPFRRVGLEKVI